jgi:hypothetical protein
MSIMDETLLTLEQAACCDLLPKPVEVITIRQWIWRGNGPKGFKVRLESAVLGNSTVTSVEAMKRFFEAIPLARAAAHDAKRESVKHIAAQKPQKRVSPFQMDGLTYLRSRGLKV